MGETRIPGVAAKHVIISDECRKNRTDQGALQEAVRQVSEEYEHLTKGHPVGKRSRMHLVLTVERTLERNG